MNTSPNCEALLIMKIRKNYGDNIASNFGPMLNMEGGRENLIPGNPFSSEYCIVNIDGAEFLGAQQHPQLPSIPVWTFQIQRSAPFHIKIEIKCQREHLGYTFSTFGITPSLSPLDLRLTFSDGDERKCDNFHMTQELVRFQVAHEFATAPTSLFVELKSMSVNDQFSEKPTTIGFSFLSIEEGLFASSPIPPGEPRGIRGGEQLSFQRADNFFENCSGTVLLFFVPNWTGPQLGSEGSAYLLDCISDDRMNSISIFSDGADYGRIKASIVTEGINQTIATDVIPIRAKMYAVALRWTADTAELIINGRAVAEFAKIVMPDKHKLGDQVYIGSTNQSANLSVFGDLSNVIATEWQSDNVLRAIAFEAYPFVFPQFEADLIKLLNPQPELITSQSWSFNLVLKVLSLQRTWQEAPPEWLQHSSIDEAHFRDEVHRLLQVLEFNSSTEANSIEGRTDLLVSDKNNEGNVLRMEFKVWNRNDSSDIPRKPLKYFTDGESVGIVVMINPNKRKPINDDYRTNVYNSPTDCFAIADKPFEKRFFPDHFISLHKQPATGYYAEVLHIVFDRYGPFAEKNF